MTERKRTYSASPNLAKGGRSGDKGSGTRGASSFAQHLIRLLVVGLIGLSSVACSQEDPAATTEKNFTLKDWLCAQSPEACHGKRIQEIYFAPPDTLYQAEMSGKKLKIPYAYLDPVIMSLGPLKDVKPNEELMLRTPSTG
jgi:hypothetical protein